MFILCLSYFHYYWKEIHFYINTYFTLNLHSSSPAADNIEVASAAANGTGNADSKNKDGNGNKRKNRRSPTDSLTSGDVRTNASPQSHFKSMEDFVAHEEIFLNGVFSVLSQVQLT